MATYKLYYFKTRGRAEQIRLLLAELGQTWEHVVVNRDNFGELKAQGPQLLPFGAVPMLEDGDLRLAQSPVVMMYLARKHGITPSDPHQAARTDSVILAAEDLRMTYFKLFGDGAEEKQKTFIESTWQKRWLPNLDGLLELNGDNGCFVGDELTAADIAMWDVLDAILVWVKGATLNDFSRLQSFYDSIKNRERIASYLTSELRLE